MTRSPAAVYVLDRRAIRCTRAQCRGAVLTASADEGIRIALLNASGRVRCVMEVADFDFDAGTVTLRGCEAIRGEETLKGTGGCDGTLLPRV